MIYLRAVAGEGTQNIHYLYLASIHYAIANKYMAFFIFVFDRAVIQ